MSRTAVFLDRDGVINRPLMRGRTPRAPRSLAEVELLPDVPQALAALKAAGYWLVVVTNQPDVARGTTPRAAVDAIHAWLKSVLPLDAIRTCTHDDQDRCACRKPLPGLLTQAAQDLRLECTSSYMVGDSWRDVEAGKRAGCRTFFVDHGYLQPPPATATATATADFRVGSLLQAARIILQAGATP